MAAQNASAKLSMECSRLPRPERPPGKRRNREWLKRGASVVVRIEGILATTECKRVSRHGANDLKFLEWLPRNQNARRTGTAFPSASR